MKKVVALLIVLGVLGWFGYEVYRRIPTGSGGPRHGREMGPVPVEAKPVRKGTVRDVGRFTGWVLAKSQFHVAAKIGGRLERLLVDVGDTVRNGQLIAQLDSAEYVQQVAQAQAELEVAKANVMQAISNLEVARKKLARYRALYEKKVTSESEIEVVEAEYKVQEAAYEVAKARVHQNEAALEAAKVQEAYTKISASWENGAPNRLIAERFVDQGTMLKANEPIVSIIDISSVTAVIHVIEREYGKMRIGQEATVTAYALPEETFRCRVVRVAPLLKEMSGQGRVELEIPNPKGILKPGMFIRRAEIEFARFEDATLVPRGSVVERNGTQGIFIVDTESMKVRFVPVKLGLVEDETAQVLEPAVSGLVVTMGQHLLQDGHPVTLPGVTTGQQGSAGGSVPTVGTRRDVPAGGAP